MKPAQRGFTLIELLIVISLVIVITGAVIPSFNTYIDNQNVKQAQQTVIDDLRTVQNKALNGELAQTELGPANDESVKYWGVEFTPGLATYDLFISVNTDTCVAAADPTRRQEVSTSKKLPGGSVVRSNSGCMFISYDNGDIANTITDTITVGPDVVATDVCRRIVVSANGLILAEDVAETDCGL